jgi:two-component system sensor histidine kinase YesM
MDLILGGRKEASDGGKGLRNINERIKMRFGERFGILVENREPAGTRVTVTIPFKEPSDGSEGRATFGGAVP